MAWGVDCDETSDGVFPNMLLGHGPQDRFVVFVMGALQILPGRIV